MNLVGLPGSAPELAVLQRPAEPERERARDTARPLALV